MHGEAWVNNAIQEADLLIALGMRFDDRVTGNLKTYAPNASKIHVDIDRAEINKNVRVDVGDRQGPARGARRVAAATSSRRDRAAWLARIDALQGRLRGPRHPEPAGRRASVRGARHQRPLAPDRRARRSSSPTSASTRCGRRSTTSTTGRGRSSPRAASARWASRCRRRSARRSRCPDAEVWVVVGDGGFQMTMCGAGDGRAGAPRHQHRDHQQRLFSAWCASGRSSSTTSATPRRRSPGPNFAKLADAFGIPATTVTKRERGRGRGRSRRARQQRAALIDFQVEQEDAVYPMVPAGADLHKMIRRPSPIVETAAD